MDAGAGKLRGVDFDCRFDLRAFDVAGFDQWHEFRAALSVDFYLRVGCGCCGSVHTFIYSGFGGYYADVLVGRDSGCRYDGRVHRHEEKRCAVLYERIAVIVLQAQIAILTLREAK